MGFQILHNRVTHMGGPMGDPNVFVVRRLIGSLNEVSGLPEDKTTSKKMYSNLVRRIELLSSLFEELKDIVEELGEDVVRAFEPLRVALDSDKVLLRSVNELSRLHQALQRDEIADKVHQMTEQIEAALSKIPYDKLNISEEVQELIQLVHARFERAKGRMDSPDRQLDMDLAIAQEEKDPDVAVLKRLSEKLQLRTINDLKEIFAFLGMAIASRGYPGEGFEKMSSFVKKLKDCVLTWIPKADIELPKKPGTCRNKKSGSSASDCVRADIKALLQKLADGNMEEQRAAAGELRLLARNADNRVCIAEAGAVPLLVELLSSIDPRTQEQAVTALLNLSINDTNKGSIVNAGAIPDIVDVLKNGSVEARENAAATLWSLSVIDENRVAIGAAGAIPALIDLLCQGTPRGKKDAAAAISNLSIYKGNMVRAVRAGIVAPLMRILKDAGGGMVDEPLLTILDNLARHRGGKLAIGEAEPIPLLMEVIRTGSPDNRENAASVLRSLCKGDGNYLRIARELGAEEALKELSENGNDRAKRIAGNILELLQRVEVVVSP